MKEFQQPTSKLETMSDGERANLFTSLENVDKYVIECHGGVSTNAFRVPQGKIVCMIIPSGCLGLEHQILSTLRAKGQHMKLLLRGIKHPVVNSGQRFGEYVRVYLPGEWAPDARLEFERMPFPGVFKLENVEKPWLSAVNEHGILTSLRPLSIIRFVGAQSSQTRMSFSELMYTHLADTSGIFFAHWCRYPRTVQEARFQWKLEKPTRVSRSLVKDIYERTSRQPLFDSAGKVIKESLHSDKKAHELAREIIRKQNPHNETLKEYKRTHPRKRIKLSKDMGIRCYFTVPDDLVSRFSEPIFNDSNYDLEYIFTNTDGKRHSLRTSQLYPDNYN